MLIPGFACFSKYLFEKGIEMRQVEEKRDCVLRWQPCFNVKDVRERAGIGDRVRLDCLSVTEK